MRVLIRCRWVVLGLIAFVCKLGAGEFLAAQGFGSFEGEVATVWLPDGRKMRLTSDFAYRDPVGKRWVAPKDSVIDGASVPQIFWTPVGGPFEGPYRKASVLHDVACVERTETWQAVHKMFYYAMRAASVSESRAALMYAAVYKFGPRWEEPKGFWGRLGSALGRLFGGRPFDGAAPTAPGCN